MPRTARNTVNWLLACSLATGLGACATSGPRRDGPDNDLERLRAERDRLAQSNLVLEDELRWAHQDLAFVERQFTEVEQRLNEEFGKAAAVAFTAEARINAEETRKASQIPDSTMRHVTRLLDMAEDQIRRNKFPAAFFFVERANHTLQSAVRRSNMDFVPTTRTVTTDGTNLREGPGQHYAVVLTLRAGARVSCLDVSQKWCRVVTSGGETGWIHDSLLH